MRRRQFLGLLGGTATWPLSARAQQASKLPTIGLLGTATSGSVARSHGGFCRSLDPARLD